MRNAWRALAALCFLSACASVPQGAQPAQSFGFLAFGDHGYHMDYFTADDLEEAPRTQEAFIEMERADWIADRRPPAEFEVSPMFQLPNGGYVPASGMMPVAEAMRSYCDDGALCQFGVLLGDNIYPDGATVGADGRDDAQRFADIFAAPYASYTELGDDFRIYASLGNHDWHTSREGALAQVDYLTRTRPFYMDGLIYSVRPPAAHGEVEIFVLDTHVLLSSQTIYEDALAEDASEIETTEVEESEPWARPQTDPERNMVQWLDQALQRSTARWRIVIGHHPLWSSAGSKFQQARVLRRLLLPTLCRNADMYLAGHEHTLEIHTDSCAAEAPGSRPLPAIVSGAAAKQRPLNTAFMAHQTRNNAQLDTIWARGMVWGFAHVQLEGDTATIEMLTTPDEGSGVPVHAETHTFQRRTGGP